jgi:TRAP-type C4-dicarboxylate transport system substrate-binding protein
MSARGRLRTLALIGAAAIVATGCTGGAGGGDKAGGGGEPVVLRMANASQKDCELCYAPAVEYFVQRVRELSGGNILIDVVDRWGNFSPDAEGQVVRAVSTGAVDLGWSGTRVFDTLGVNSFQALTAPMLIDSYALEDAVIRAGITAEMLKNVDALGVSGLAVLADGLRKPTAVKGPLLGPADWNGITFQSFRSQGQSAAIRALGAQPTDVIGPAFDQGLDQGQIQGFEKNLLVYQLNVMEHLAPYVTANVNLWPQMDVLLANPARLAALPEKERGWLQQAAGDAAALSTGLVDRENEIVSDVCPKGARFSNASEADLAALRQAFVPVSATLEQDPQTKAFIQRIEALKRVTAAGPALGIPAGCTGSGGPPATDPLAGTWTTGPITQSQWRHAYIAAGGSEKDAHESFGSDISHKSVTFTFQDGVFKVYCSDDGRPPDNCDHGGYEVGDDGTLTLYTGGTETYRYDLSGDTLRLYFVKGDCGIGCDYGALPPLGPTLYAGFPFTRSG